MLSDRVVQERKRALIKVLRCSKQRKTVGDAYELLVQDGHSVATINTAVDILHDEDCIDEFLIGQTKEDEFKLGWRLTWNGAEMMSKLGDEERRI